MNCCLYCILVPAKLFLQLKDVLIYFFSLDVKHFLSCNQNIHWQEINFVTEDKI